MNENTLSSVCKHSKTDLRSSWSSAKYKHT